MNVKMLIRDILIILFTSNVIQNVLSFNENSFRKTKTSNTLKNNYVMLNKDNSDNNDKFKIITPDNIASLFNNNIQKIYLETTKLNDNENEEDNNIIDNLEEEEYIDSDDNDDSIIISDDNNINTMKDLQELEYLTKIPPNPTKPFTTTTTLINSYDDLNTNEDNDEETNDSYVNIFNMKSSSTTNNFFEEDFEEYSNLSGPLNKNKLQQVQAAMSMYDSSSSLSSTYDNNKGTIQSSSALNDSMVARRIFKFDPTENDRADRMQYGAYRRWKAPELEPGSNTVTKPKSNKMRNPGGSGGVGNNNSGRKKSPTNNKKNKNGMTSDNFYNAIKNLGSGPVEKGSTQGTGVAEPPPGKKNIQPKKAPARTSNANAKKKIITPSDINSLFTTKQNKLNDNDDDDDVYNVNNSNEDDNFENDESNKKSIDRNGNIATSTTTTTSSISTSTFNPMIGPNEEMPQWLIDADKEAKKKNKAMKNRKKKKLTDDWRFWAAIISGVGFISAFINIYQKTGGFGSGDYNNDASSGNEMLI